MQESEVRQARLAMWSGRLSKGGGENKSWCIALDKPLREPQSLFSAYIDKERCRDEEGSDARAWHYSTKLDAVGSGRPRTNSPLRTFHQLASYTDPMKQGRDY